MAASALTAAMDQAGLIDARRDTAAIAPVVPLGALARYDRPAPSLTDYDDLLTGSESWPPPPASR
jgi:hypothetical protein